MFGEFGNIAKKMNPLSGLASGGSLRQTALELFVSGETTFRLVREAQEAARQEQERALGHLSLHLVRQEPDIRQ